MQIKIRKLPAVTEAVSEEGVITKALRKEQGASLAGAGRLMIQIVVGFFGGWLFAGIGLVIGLASGMREPFGFILIGFVVGWVLLGSLIGRTLHPNVALANEILNSGTIPLDKIGPALNAVGPSERERQAIAQATSRLQSDHHLFFDGCFVLPSSHPYALTFGSYLFLSRGAIESADLEKVLAHELGHLNNGDSFVKCALWAIGKGWTREYMSLTGKIGEPTAENQTHVGGLGGLAHAAIRRQWEVAVAEAALLSIFSTGSSLRGMEEDLRFYFGKWDIEADRVAEALVHVSGYRTYLRNLANFEKGMGTMPLSASAELRYDRSLRR